MVPIKPSLRELEKLQPWKFYLAVAIDWIIIICSCWLVIEVSHWFAPLAWLVIASRQHALLVLMHEQVHFRIGRSKFWTEFFSDVFLAFPILVSTRLYRRTHFRHHLELNTNQDPDFMFMKTHKEWNIPKSNRAFWGLVFKDICFLHWRENFIHGPFVTFWSPLKRLFRSKDHPDGGLSGSYKTFVVAYYSIIGVVIYALNLFLPVVVLWILPMSTLLPAMVRLRAMPEHLGLSQLRPKQGTRTIAGMFWLESFLVAPHGIHLHYEHHLNPRIPFYNLSKAHCFLEKESLTQNSFKSYFGKAGALADLLKEPSFLTTPYESNKKSLNVSLEPFGEGDSKTSPQDSFEQKKGLNADIKSSSNA